MEENFQFQVESSTKENTQKILDGLNEFNLSKVPALASIWTPLDFVAKDQEGNVIGGILGGIGYWNGLEIKALWVKEEFRNQGIGTKLLKQVEAMAQSMGATISMLDTFDFQAEDFYLKNGYSPIGEIKDFPQGHRRVYFSKKLNG